MKSYKKILFLFLMFIFASTYAEKQNGDPNSTNQRTPEQEASKQTEKLQTELNLTREQAKALYQINLRYAQARQNVSSRSGAMQIIKNKDEDIRRVLTSEQNDQLNSKRVTRQPVEVGENTQYTRTNPALRSSYSNRDENRKGVVTRTTQSQRNDENTNRDVRTNNSYNRQSSVNQSSTRSSYSSSSSRESSTRSTSGGSSRGSNSGSSERPSGRR